MRFIVFNLYVVEEKVLKRAKDLNNRMTMIAIKTPKRTLTTSLSERELDFTITQHEGKFLLF